MITDIESNVDLLAAHLLNDAAVTLDNLLWLLESHQLIDGHETAHRTPV